MLDARLSVVAPRKMASSRNQPARMEWMLCFFRERMSDSGEMLTAIQTAVAQAGNDPRFIWQDFVRIAVR